MVVRAPGVRVLGGGGVVGCAVNISEQPVREAENTSQEMMQHRRTLVANEYYSPLHREMIVRQEKALFEHLLVRQQALEAEKNPHR